MDSWAWVVVQTMATVGGVLVGVLIALVWELSTLCHRDDNIVTHTISEPSDRRDMPGNWQDKYRQLIARRNAIDAEIEKAKRAADTIKLAKLHRQRVAVVREINKILDQHR